MNRLPRILLVDDDEDDRVLTQELLRDAFGEDPVLDGVADWDEALQAVLSGRYDIYLVDYRLGDRDGLDLIREAVARGCQAPSILLTGQDSRNVDLSAGEAGASDYLVKGDLTPPLLERAIRYAIARQQFLKTQIEANELLKKKNFRLSQLYRTAHQFVDNVSHEFRTPLTVIREFISILQDGLAGEINETQREYLGIAIERVDDLNLMVNDMLDFSRLEAGLLGLSREACRVEDIVERVRPTLERKALSRKITLDIAIEKGLPRVYCDAEKIGRVIINLVVNAIKFCRDHGRTTLFVRRGNDGAELLFGVTDDGPGIETEHLEKIFRRHEQLGADEEHGTKGFGLGLNIVKQLVEMHLGDVSVRSRRGHGSTFSFTIPTFQPRRVFERHIGRLASVEGDSWSVALIPIQVDLPADPGLMAELGTFLRHQVRDNDLLFSGKPGSWLLVATIGRSDLKRLFRRFQEALSAANRNRVGNELPRLNFEPAGIWHPSHQSREMVESFAAVFDKMAGDRSEQTDPSETAGESEGGGPALGAPHRFSDQARGAM